MKIRAAILNKIKQWTLISIVSCLVITCSYENIKTEKDGKADYQSKGVITGPDMRLCPSPCCGGWHITIDSTNYNFNSLPEGSGIDLQTAKFPLLVKLDWHMDNLGCNLIDITRIALDK